MKPQILRDLRFLFSLVVAGLIGQVVLVFGGYRRKRGVIGHYVLLEG